MCEIAVAEVQAESVLDIGCGTGVLALLLADRGVRVTGVDPATASIAVAQSKRGANDVTWVAGTVEDLPPMQVDLAMMTGNVAQVFLDDHEWLRTLRAARAALRPGGVLVFEARRPEERAWLRWTKQASHRVVHPPGVGDVEDWVEVTRVDGELVTFDSRKVFLVNAERLDSTSTLHFRTRTAIEQSLAAADLQVFDVRDITYAPGRGWMYLARRADNTGGP